jgi:type I restriction enzyme S subunit
VNQAVAVFRVDKRYWAPFVSYYFQAPDTINRILDMQVDVARPNISLGDLRRFLIALPLLPEQHAIAAALSDVDALIGALDQLIAKKRDLKQAAMQQLLSGQRRLPGFHEEWKVRRLSDESELITKGTTPTSLGRRFTEQGMNFVKVESLTEDGTVIPERLAAIDEETHRLLKRSQLRENDILFSIAGALGRTALVKSVLLPANTNQALALIRLKTQSCLKHGFLIKFLSSFQIARHIAAINVQAAQANLSLEDIRGFEVPVPAPNEQIAIATVLSDMDEEIAALEARLAKTCALKQGMMQDLLTGRTRLL